MNKIRIFEQILKESWAIKEDWLEDVYRDVVMDLAKVIRSFGNPKKQTGHYKDIIEAYKVLEEKLEYLV